MPPGAGGAGRPGSRWNGSAIRFRDSLTCLTWHRGAKFASNDAQMGGLSSTVRWHRDPPSGGLRPRQLGVRALHPGEASSDLRREGGDLLRLHVDVQRQVFGGGRNPAFARVKELLEIVHALGVVIEELKGDPYRVLGVELAQVAHVHLGGVAGVLAGPDVVEAAAEQFERLVDRAI